MLRYTPPKKPIVKLLLLILVVTIAYPQVLQIIDKSKISKIITEGDELFQKNEYPLAIIKYLKIENVDSNNSFDSLKKEKAKVFCRIGNTLSLSERNEEAIKYYKKALEYDSSVKLSSLNPPSIEMFIIAKRQFLLTKLQTADTSIKLSLIKTFGNTEDHETIKIFVNLLQDKDNRVREEAIKVLLNMNHFAVNPLIEVIDDTNSFILRIEAIKLLGRIKNIETVEPLIITMKDKNFSVRCEAIKAIGNINDTRTVEPLLFATKDNEAVVRREAVKVLGEIRENKAVNRIITISINDESSDVRKEAVIALGKINNAKAIQSLIVAIKDKDLEVRKEAVRALGDTKDPKAVEPLVNAFKNINSDIQNESVAALGKMGPPAILPLVSILVHKNSDVRKKAAYALEELGWKPIEIEENINFLFASQKWDELEKIGYPCAKKLISALKDNDSVVRKGAIRTLGYINYQESVNLLIAVLKDDDQDVRREAVEALGNLKNPSAIKPLSILLNDRRKFIQKSAIQSLGKIGGEAIIPIYSMLTDWYLNKEVIEALSTLGWRPETDEDMVHWWVANRTGSALRKDWNTTKKILLKDVEAMEYRTIENALLAFIGIGETEIIQTLIEKLYGEGNKVMAEAYLNCGHPELDKAARSWAAKNGYTVLKGSGAHPVAWGRM